MSAATKLQIDRNIARLTRNRDELHRQLIDFENTWVDYTKTPKHALAEYEDLYARYRRTCQDLESFEMQSLQAK